MQESFMQEILQECKAKQIENIAFVTNVFSKAGSSDASRRMFDGDERFTHINIRLIRAYDPKIQKSFVIAQDPFGNDKHAEMMLSCAIGDIIQYSSTSFDTWVPGLPYSGKAYQLLENFSAQKRLSSFMNAYNAVYGGK